MMVSLVVPVYNAEKYIDRCINSIIGQTYQNIELILVDDGSTDQSYEICSNWSKLDKRVKFFHQENAGVSAARNMALGHCEGQYIVFVDADDYIESTFCSEMTHIMDENKVDVVFCEHKKVFLNAKQSITGENSGKVSIIPSYKYEYDGVKERRAIWGAIYKAELISGLKFPDEIAIGEDALFLINVINRVSRIAYYDKPLYNYVIQNESAYFGEFNIRKLTEINAWLKICESCTHKLAQRSANAACAETAVSMLGRYAGDAGFESKYINRLVNVYRSKLPQLIQYDHQKNRKTFKHILYGLFPHIFVKYWGWENEKKRRNCNAV